MNIEENIKIKNLLKGMFENQEFETTYQDEDIEYNHEEDLLEDVYEEYTFKYYMEVGKVLGEGTKTVASINVIITDFTVDGEDMLLGWKEIGYNEDVWYINTLENEIYEDKLQDIPISIYLTFYGYDEYENLPLEEKNL
jgi:hypothetical protein